MGKAAHVAGGAAISPFGFGVSSTFPPPSQRRPGVRGVPGPIRGALWHGGKRKARGKPLAETLHLMDG